MFQTHVFFVLICILVQVSVLLITQLPILSIHFIIALSYNRYIRYRVLHTLFLSISMAVIDYTCIESVSGFSKFKRLLLN